MVTCKFWIDQADKFHGNCGHPEARPGDSCILNTEDECLLREEGDIAELEDPSEDGMR